MEGAVLELGRDAGDFPESRPPEGVIISVHMHTACPALQTTRGHHQVFLFFEILSGISSQESGRATSTQQVAKHIPIKFPTTSEMPWGTELDKLEFGLEYGRESEKLQGIRHTRAGPEVNSVPHCGSGKHPFMESFGALNGSSLKHMLGNVSKVLSTEVKTNTAEVPPLAVCPHFRGEILQGL
ncbi:hypothetical protein STEG23_005779, partial [Scotinomys teguina]